MEEFKDKVVVVTGGANRLFGQQCTSVDEGNK